MLVELSRVGRAFDTRWAVRDISTQLRPGSVLAVLGANGAGKTTLLRLLAGWLPLSEGVICFDGAKLRHTATNLRRRVMLLDETLRGNMQPATVLSRQIEDYRADRAGIEDEVARWFDTFDVSKVSGKQIRTLSKGQWYKMLLANLFAIRPALWLLDEPFSAGLDAIGIQVLESEIRRHRAAGGCVAFASQWPDHARRLASQVLVLHEGRCAWESESVCAVPADKVAEADGSLRAVLEGLSSPR